MQQPGVIIKAAVGTEVEGKLSLAEAAGIRAIFAEIQQIQHRRRELAMQDQKEAVTEESTIEALDAAWKELCVAHNFDPNVPVSAWGISKKNRATLHEAYHPGKLARLPGGNMEASTDGREESDQPGAHEVPGGGRAEPGDSGPAGAGGGDADD